MTRYWWTGLLVAVAGLTLLLADTLHPAGAVGYLEIATGNAHSCALQASGDVTCWGSNFFGQLGDGTTTSHSNPTTVSGLPAGITSVVAAGAHTCALTADGDAYCWGSDEYGELGDGSHGDGNLETLDNIRITPVKVAGLSGRVTRLAAGVGHTCALMESGSVRCWGANFAGQLGDGTLTDRTAPKDVLGLPTGATDIGAGAGHTCVVTTSGEALCWGWNHDGQIGDNSTGDPSCSCEVLPVDVMGLSESVTLIRAGWYHTCALLLSGSVECWGSNDFGQIGDGERGLYRHKAPTKVIGLKSAVVSLGLGSGHSCAVTADNHIECWGLNDMGQIGGGLVCGLDACLTPQLALNLDNAVGVAAGGVEPHAEGYGHTCAVTAQGTAKCWGSNNNGQLGQTTTEERCAAACSLSPIDVPKPVEPPSPTLPPPTVTPTTTPSHPNGDANCSGHADAIDAAVILQYDAGLAPSLSCPLQADVNHDGHTNTLDVALVLQFVAGILHNLPP